jgi:putative two-component system response regulator
VKILVVDDDITALAIARKILKSEGHEVLLAENAEEALEVMRKLEFQVVILDWNMPGMDGIELCHYLRSQPTLGYIFIIMVTARNSKQDMLTGLDAGADDFIAKPFEPAELLVRLRNAERILSLQTVKDAIFAFAKFAEARDSDTGMHLERIREYTRLLATHLANDPRLGELIPPHFPELLYETSPLHDIGKVKTPDVVLNKPGKLNPDEWVIMKRHAGDGAQILNEVVQKYPGAENWRIARDIAWCHHERWDGSGYPRGLKGSEIPLSARIVTLADVYDALTTKRVYKDAFSHQAAREIIIESRCSHFDPQLVDAFLEIEDRFMVTKDRLADEPVNA